MNIIKELIDKFMRTVDNGLFFREPMKWLYFFFGAVAFLPAFAFLIATIYFIKFNYYTSWEIFTFVVNIICVFTFLLALGYLGWSFWSNRRRDLQQVVRIGDRINAIPIVAHYIQSVGEATFVFLFIAPIGTYIITFIIGLLNGFSIFGVRYLDVENYFKAFFALILVFIGLVIGLFGICYLGILFTHFITEKMRIKAQLANDLRDVADIQRAAILPEEM